MVFTSKKQMMGSMSKKRYTILIREVHVAHHTVSANSKEEAVKMVKDGESCEEYIEYSHTMDDDTWQIEEVKDESQ